MKLKTKYLLFVGTVHLLMLALSFVVFERNRLLFLVSEVLILVSVFFSWRLYRALIDPLNMLVQGTEAIRDRDFSVKLLRTGSFEMDKLIDVYNQMIEELRTERLQQERQHFFLEKLIQTSPTGIIVLDFNGMIQQVNPRAINMLGIEETALKNGTHQHPILQAMQELKSGEAKTLAVSGVQTYKIQKSHFIDRGFSRHFIMIEELTAEILAAEKKVYEKVIRMMAHEVNNTTGPVNSIMSSALHADALWQSGTLDTLREAFEVAIERNNNLNGFMRGFADLVKLPLPEKRNIDINRLLRSVARLMELRAADSNIKIEAFTPSTEWWVPADAQLMEQALINIVKNGIEAIEGKGIVQLLADPATRTITVSDTGRGIPSEVGEHVFSPFYSTKRDGQGIGLTLVREVLLNHGFRFSLNTLRPGNTRFTIHL
ncbi:PAS domain-containing sensor histidine kinase [Parasegetibacter sp. NRK P23]|uniref:sensor histidine kinase n=1 Tax=Parasegetibacter sp. NRK P23 TaxID=2942999 RepID=UPI0020435BAE|nr:ATP-binding protein [Parasegetibacter sp. NRK P23]MCM5527341.1 ATP-binding protein [Parasegetibacter sp. NRK P23]